MILTEFQQNNYWWPNCIICKRIVDNVEILGNLDKPGMRECDKKAFVGYRISCHGTTEDRIMGVWAAWGIIKFRERVQDYDNIKMDT